MVKGKVEHYSSGGNQVKASKQENSEDTDLRDSVVDSQS